MADVLNIAGMIHSISESGDAMYSDELYDKLKEKKQSKINEEVGDELGLHESRLNALTGQNYVSVQATQSTTAAGIPTMINATGEGEQLDTIYRVGFWDGSAYVADKYTEYAWTGTEYVILDVKSSIGEVFDISQYNSVGGTPATYANLTAALGASGENVPSSVRRGGMSIKFVLSSDNKYVQYFLTSTSWSTNVDDWVEGGGGSGDGAYDISAENSGATYDNLTAALGANGANVPSDVRNGGMSVKYIENVYADYSVVVTEGLTTEPTGTLLESAPSITSGTYKASQLTDFSTLPANPYNSVLYYIAVAGDTTTYTQWVITKKTNDSTQYAHWTYKGTSVADADIVNLDNWVGSLEDEAETIKNNVADVSYTDIGFNGGNYYIAQTTGVVTANANFRGSGYIPVNEGDEFYYSGYPGSVSLGAAGYSYDGSTYTYVRSFVEKGTELKNDALIVIPEGVTHIFASCDKNYISSAVFKRKNTSKLSDIVDGFDGEIETTEVITDFIQGHYVNINGSWGSSNSYYYKFIDVEVGDVIELYHAKVGVTTVAILSKKISDTPTFEILIAPEDNNYHDYKYAVTENMTVCICITDIRQALIRKNKVEALDVRIGVLEANQALLEQNKDWLNEYDYRLGILFDNIAVIGDSMSVGSLSSQAALEVSNNFGASWLSFLAKRWGCKSRYHYAKGGTSTYMWLNDSSTYGLGTMLRENEPVYNAYFIAYGHNDSAITPGSASDAAAPVTITDRVPSCPSGYTFCAYYKAIIDQIRAKAPHAMIFCMSEYDNLMCGESRAAYRQGAINVAEWYRTQGDKLVFHLETGGVPNLDMGLGTHYSTIGYTHIAKRTDEEVNKVVYANIADEVIKTFGSFNEENVR